MYPNAGRIFTDAVTWAEQIKAEDTEPAQPQALVSLIYAPMSIETFMNELVFHATQYGIKKPGPRLQAFADVLTEMEESKTQIKTKVQMGKFILTGESFDKGKYPYQDFDLLVNLRNEIIHQKAHEELAFDDQGNETIRKRKILKPFEDRKLLGKVIHNGQEAQMNWLDEISTRAMAVWACNAAAGILNEMLYASMKIGGVFSLILEKVYQRDFQYVERLSKKPARA